MASTIKIILSVGDTPIGFDGNNSITTNAAYITSLNIIIPLTVIRFKNIYRFRYNN